MSAEILVRRPNAGYQDRLRAYRIKVDGEDVGKLRVGEDLRVAVDGGSHELLAVLDTIKSPALQFHVEDGTSMVIEVAPNDVPWYRRLFSRQPWIAIRTA
jgi:hypothetical protein